MNIDHAAIKAAQKGMVQAKNKLKEMVPAIGHALHIIEMDSDYRKRMLARYTKTYLEKIHDKSGNKISHAQAETLARADEDYGQELEAWGQGLEAAFTVRKDWESTEARLEVARSINSTETTIVRRFVE